MASVLAVPLLAQSPPRGLVIMAQGEGLRSTREVSRLVENIAPVAFDQLILEVRGYDGTLYDSDLEPRAYATSPGAPEDPVRALEDALTDDGRTSAAIWLLMETLPSYDAEFTSRPPEGSTMDRLSRATMFRADGEKLTSERLMLLDPGVRATQEHLLAMIREVAERYQPPGIVLNGIAFPSAEWGYNAQSIAAFRAAVGGVGPPPPDNGVWMVWRREVLTYFLRQVDEMLAEVSPDTRLGVIVSAEGPAPSSWAEWEASTAYRDRLQDWVGWAEEGLVDVLYVSRPTRPGLEEEYEFNEWLDFARAHSYGAKVTAWIDAESAIPADLIGRLRGARRRGAGVALSHYAKPARQVLNDYFEQMLPGALGVSAAVVRPDEPFEHQRRRPDFSRVTTPPPSLDPTPTPTPTPTPEPLRRTPAPTPTPDLFDAPPPPPLLELNRQTQRIVMKNGQIIEGVVVRRDDLRGTFRVRLDNGTMLTLEDAQVESLSPLE
ncbi:MAG: family 10 glycosylhydrolase [Sumerlaeia bacterium]